ncbi:amidohydrolase [Motilibacter aurantiacus]|uniref:amidohydrolase n=1 Tax=Motilibacter aurantiacus TaxID=2714955 RepID=UPI00140BC785|nr:amidohydrolase [Motilibacter aurantiacus]NHC45691.1 amidohydrolase [Motilibacter aurantiacus]
MPLPQRSFDSAPVVAVTGGHVVPISAPPIEDGTVLIRDGVIEQVGRDVPIPPEARVVDASGKWVLPGLVDAHTHIGIHEEGSSPEGDDTNETSAPTVGGIRAMDAVDCDDVGFRDALSAGITTVSVKPGSGTPIGGLSVAMKTWGGRFLDEQVIRAEASVKSAFGENPKLYFASAHQLPMTRMGVAGVIRQRLEDAKAYAAQREQAEKDGAPFTKDLELDALCRLLDGDLVWDVHLHRHDDIATAVRIAEEFGLRLVVHHGTESHKLADMLAERDIPVAVGPIITSRAKPELSGHTVKTAAILAEAGVRVAIVTDHPECPVNFLVLQALLAVREGLDPETALQALTVNPARMMQLEDRVGALAPGLDGDVVVWSGDPLGGDTRVEQVLIGGGTVYRWDAERGEGEVAPRFSPPHR